MYKTSIQTFTRATVQIYFIYFKTLFFLLQGTLARGHCDQLRMSEDLQSSLPPPVTDQMGQV